MILFCGNCRKDDMGKVNKELISEMRAKGFVTIAEAARIVRRSKWTVYYWAEHILGLPNVRRLGKSWFVCKVAVQMFAHGRRAGGAPW